MTAVRVKGTPIFMKSAKLTSWPSLRSMPTPAMLAEAPMGVRLPPRVAPTRRPKNRKCGSVFIADLGEYDPQGAVYIENFNHKDMSDFDTIVYGHSMLNGNMFGTLHNFSDWNFFNSYGGIVLYTPTATYYYQVFETATIDDSHIFTYLDNGSYQSRASYVERLAGYTNGFKKDGYSISPDDHILTLSTCTTDDTKRLVVFAVLVSTTTN